jgi:serine phosphatase RsbU (regulator of sigma subunit)
MTIDAVPMFGFGSPPRASEVGIFPREVCVVRATNAWLEQVPLHVVPGDLTTEIADLAFAGRYIPAGPGPDPIAGDFWDLVTLEPDLIALVVGDVAGHGVAAVARMQQLRAATRAYAVIEHGPASVVRRLDVLCARLDPESIATLWYGEYQPSTGRLTYASAGHPPPVLIWHRDPTRLLQVADAPPLGVGTAGDHVVEHHDALAPGAVLVAYSDGLVERRGADLEDQLTVLASVVTTACEQVGTRSVHEISTNILDTLVPSPDMAEDDVCLLVVRRSGDGEARTTRLP